MKFIFSSITGFAVDENQPKNDLSRRIQPAVKKDIIKIREKREIDVVANKTVQVHLINCSL